MAVDAPLLTKQRTVALKTETTTGTAETLAAANGIINAYDAAFTHDVEIAERPTQGNASQRTAQAGARSGRLTFWSELMGDGSGNELAILTSLLPACGLAEGSANVFTPTTGAAAAPTVTAGLYTDGELSSIAGAVGNLEITATRGQPVRCNWEWLGVLQADSATALITPTYPTIAPMKFLGATFTIGGVTCRVSTFSVNLGNELVLREDGTAATGYHAAIVANRKVMVTLDPESDPIGTRSWQALMLANTESALSIVVSSATDKCTIACPKLQVVGVTPADRSGIYVKQLECQANLNSSGDDELSLTFAAP